MGLDGIFLRRALKELKEMIYLPLVENLSKRFSNLGVKFIVANEEDPCIYYSK